MSRIIRGIRNIPINIPYYWENLLVFVCASKGKSIETIDQG
jgi:hypothetical protein